MNVNLNKGKPLRKFTKLIEVICYALKRDLLMGLFNQANGSYITFVGPLFSCFKRNNQ